VRPAEPERPRLRQSGPAGRVRARVPGVRLLVRRPLAVVPAIGPSGWVRRFTTVLAAAVAAAAVVAVLGLLAEAAAASRGQEGAAERMVTDGSIAPVPPGPGQVHRVTFG
jgi:hypothetical protein